MPPVPADLALCFDSLTPAPGKKGQPITKAQTQALIIALRTSEVAKSRCGKRLLAFYTNLENPDVR